MAELSDTKDLIKVEVAWAVPEEQVILAVNVPTDATLAAAIQASGVLERFTDIDLSVNDVGIFGERKPLDASLREGDRIEIYRPLQADPKEVRRRKAAEAKQRAKSTTG